MYETVSVVTVTYGDRWRYLETVLAFLETETSVARVVVIDNASNYDVADRCRQAHLRKTRVYRNDKNLGSAGGFSGGISIAAEEGEGSLILLLDDDNLPEPGAIAGLIATYNSLARDSGDGNVAVTAFRESQHGHFRVPLEPLFMRGHDFLGFNLFNAVQRHLDLVKTEAELRSGPECAHICGGAAYSGMLFSPKLVSRIGVPEPGFILYFDDCEYAVRMMRAGCLIWLDTDHKIDDLETNYSMNVFKTAFLGFLRGQSESKIYYIVRNRVYMDQFMEERRSLPYRINRSVFLSVLGAICLAVRRTRRFKTILDACRDGKRGRLGFSDTYPI